MKIRLIAAVALTLCSAYGIPARSAATSPVFEVTTIKPASPDAQGRSFRMAGAHRFTADNHTVKERIAFVYAPRSPLDFRRGTPGRLRQIRHGQRDARGSLCSFGADQADASGTHGGPVQAQISSRAKRNARLQSGYWKERKGRIENKGEHRSRHRVISLLSGLPPRSMRLPARYTTVTDLATELQRNMVDRPVIDKTGLSARYQFGLERTPDGAPPADADTKPDIFAAVQQPGPRLESAKGQGEVPVIDHAEKADDI
jgi:hypothetical protein